MSLQDKIKKIINVISDTDINEIEITSFWGAQKIRLSKSLKPSRVESPAIERKVKEVVFDTNEDENLINEQQNPVEPELKSNDVINKPKAEEESTYSEEDLTYQKVLDHYKKFYADAIEQFLK